MYKRQMPMNTIYSNEQRTRIATCSLCCEDKPASSMFVLQQCHHESCKDCLMQWIENEESSGSSSLPNCPFCRVVLSENDTLAILGRPYQPRTPIISPDEAQLDDLTLQWLQEHTRACPGCGACIEKQPGGCDMMECLCGYRFCYGCGSTNAQCSCTPENHYFWDNVLDKSAGLSPPVQAVVNEQTGQINLRAHIMKRKQQERGRKTTYWRQVRRRAAQRAEARRSALEHVIENGVWLFKHETNVGTLKLLAALYQNQARYKNKLSRALSAPCIFENYHWRQKSERDVERNSIAIRLLFLNEAEKAKEKENIKKNGL